MIRLGKYMGPLVLNWVAIGGGMDGPNPRAMIGVHQPCARRCRADHRRDDRPTWPLTRSAPSVQLDPRSLADPAVAFNAATNAREGTGQDIAAYTTFIAIR